MTSLRRPPLRRPKPGARRRHGFTLAEVLVAFVILGGASLGLAAFMMRFSKLANDQSSRSLAYDLVTTRLETIKAATVYRTIDSTYDSTTETWPASSVYAGLTRRTWVLRSNTAQRDFMTVTVQVEGAKLKQPLRLTTVIARF